MRTKNLKIRVSWTELPFLPDENWDEMVENSVVSNEYHPCEMLLSKEFTRFVSSLEEKYDVKFDHSKDNCFLHLSMGERANSSDDIANNIIIELEEFLGA